MASHRYKEKYHILFSILIGLALFSNSCEWDKPFSGQTGRIKYYSFHNEPRNIVREIDKLLLSSSDYSVRDSKYPYNLFIEYLPTSDRFGVNLGENSITLVYAGKKGGDFKIDYYLEDDERIELINSFEKNIIQKLSGGLKAKNGVVQNPFMLTTNAINQNPNQFYIIKDTLIRTELPSEFDSLSIDYFENLVQAYSQYTSSDHIVGQYCNLFSLDKKFSGHLSDSVNITRMYRSVGQSFGEEILFESREWQNFVRHEQLKSRITAYDEIRESKISKGYMPTEVYHEISTAYWMEKDTHLNCETQE